MSLIIARKINSKIVLLADTRIKDQIASRPFDPSLGISKIRFPGANFAVCFAGNIHVAEKALRMLKGKISKQEIIQHFHESSRASANATDFILAFIQESELVEIKDGKSLVVESAWIGTHAAFQKLRAYETGNACATPHG